MWLGVTKSSFQNFPTLHSPRMASPGCFISNSYFVVYISNHIKMTDKIIGATFDCVIDCTGIED